jgi:aspartate racemase
MKTIGIIGGMSWKSTEHYYQLINEYTQHKLGGHNSAQCIIYSVNFQEILDLVHKDDWATTADVIADIAQRLETAGADFILMTVNTAHKIYDIVEPKIKIPFLHIVDPTGDAIRKCGFSKIGLLGTQITMEEDFYKKRLQDRFGVEILTPEKGDREQLQKIIHEELTLGQIKENSRNKMISMIADLAGKGAEGIILGCTELTLLVTQKDTPTPLFDTTELHAKAAVDLALSNR